MNWFRLRPVGGRWEDEVVGKKVGGEEFPVLRAESGEQYEALDGARPRLLIGTMNKILSYNTGAFANLHSAMGLALEENRVLIVSGYGFGDKALNMRVAAWYRGGDDRMLIIDLPHVFGPLGNSLNRC